MLPWNGRIPVSASYSSVPTLYTSDAGVGWAPAACSGDM